MTALFLVAIIVLTRVTLFASNVSTRVPSSLTLVSCDSTTGTGGWLAFLAALVLTDDEMALTPSPEGLWTLP